MSSSSTPDKCANAVCESGQSDKLLTCAGCKSVKYCSKDCQKQDWKTHKIPCKKISGVGAGSSVDSLTYYKETAAHDPKAQALAKEMGLDLSAGGLQMPVRRLVLTGNDTPENMALFFGGKNKADIKSTLKECRMEALLRPPRGSPMYVMASSLNMDKGLPGWNPRSASSDEAKQVEEIKNMHQLIIDHMGPRGTTDIQSRDMQDILTKNFGNRWPTAIQLYQDAVNSLDQGVQV